MSVRAFRGATCLDADSFDEMTDAVVELVAEVLAKNSLTDDDLISIIFTSTNDLVSGFPATALRTAGFADVPLMCATEIPVPGSPERTIRVLIHAESDLARPQVNHVFLRGADVLRGSDVVTGGGAASNQGA